MPLASSGLHSCRRSNAAQCLPSGAVRHSSAPQAAHTTAGADGSRGGSSISMGYRGHGAHVRPPFARPRLRCQSCINRSVDRAVRPFIQDDGWRQNARSLRAVDGHARVPLASGVQESPMVRRVLAFVGCPDSILSTIALNAAISFAGNGSRQRVVNSCSGRRV